MQNASSSAAWAIVPPPRRMPAASLPDEWSAAHVQRHLLDAFDTDSREPRVARPKKPGAAHPRTSDTPDESIVRGKFDEARYAGGEYEPLRFAPDRDERATAGKVLTWLALVINLALRLALTAWLASEFDGGEAARLFCKARRLARDEFTQMKDRALAMIAFALNGRKVPVF